MNISKKLLLTLLAVSIIPLILVSSFIVLTESQDRQTEILEANQIVLEEESLGLTIFLERYSTQTAFIRDMPPILGLIRASPTGYDSQDNSTYEQWVNRLNLLYHRMMEIDPLVNHLRYIDKDGNEIIRVNNENGNLSVVPQSDLQNKATRDYFTNTINLEKDQLYISELNLNQEFDEVTLPHTPVVRFATPIFDTQGNNQGIVIINVLFQNLLERIRDYIDNPILIDQDGFYLYHQNKTLEFGKDLETSYNFFESFPGMQSEMLVGNEGSFSKDGNVLFWKKIDYAPSDDARYWLLFSVVSEEEIFAPITRLTNFFIYAIIISIIIVIITSFFVSKNLANPILRLTKEVTSLKVISHKGISKQLKNTKGEIGILANSFDKALNRHHRADIAKRKKEKDLMNIISNAPGAMFVISSKSKVLYVNKSGEKLFGTSKDKLVDKPLGIPNLSHKKIIEVLTHKGKKITETTIVDITWRGVPARLIIFYDISELKEVEKLKDELISIAGHELKTPLTSITSLSELIANEKLGKVNKEQKQSLKLINKDALRLRNLIESMLDVSRLEGGRITYNFANFNLNNIITETVRTSKVLSKERNINIDFSPKEAIKVEADMLRIRQVISNLITNAVKYGRNNGTIWISTKKKQRYALIIVKDNGIGISTENQKKLFSKMFQADQSSKRKTGGVGFGLYLSKRIVEEGHNGKLWVESTFGKGSTFYVKIPLARTIKRKKK